MEIDELILIIEQYFLDSIGYCVLNKHLDLLFNFKL